MKRSKKRPNSHREKQQKREKRIEQNTKQFKCDGAYKVFTTIHLSPQPVEFQLSLPYNYVLYDATGYSQFELSYLARCSDLLILTVSSTDVDNGLISLIKRHMPSVIILYERKMKGVARSASKLIGDVRIVEKSMLSMFLSKMETENTHLCTNRPFMVARECEIGGTSRNEIYLEGYMKNPLQSDRVVVNGLMEGRVEEARVDGELFRGSDLWTEDDESWLLKEEAQECIEEPVVEFQEEDEEFEEEEEGEYEEETVHPDYDLIQRYKDYRGVLNMATCTFKGQQKPEYYDRLVFMKSQKHAVHQVQRRTGLWKKNKFVQLKVVLDKPVEETPRIAVLFGLFSYEMRPTIWNYEFSHNASLPRNILVDNGYRIFQADCLTSRNLRHNVFQAEPDLKGGIVSFIGPYSVYGSSAHLILDDAVLRLSNGESKDRLFYESVELTGRVFKIYKRYCVVRGLFYTKGQVEYFSPVRISTRNPSNVGFIKKSLGTKGMFKAHFNHPVRHDDTIVMTLYKRRFL